jgi:hypothetical protein
MLCEMTCDLASLPPNNRILRFSLFRSIGGDCTEMNLVVSWNWSIAQLGTEHFPIFRLENASFCFPKSKLWDTSPTFLKFRSEIAFFRVHKYFSVKIFWIFFPNYGFAKKNFLRKKNKKICLLWNREISVLSITIY